MSFNPFVQLLRKSILRPYTNVRTDELALRYTQKKAEHTVFSCDTTALLTCIINVKKKYIQIHFNPFGK